MSKSEGLLEALKQATPARIDAGRAGTRPTTKAILQLRTDHAVAVDSVYGMVSDQLLEEFGLFSVDTCFESKEVYLRRPDLGRILSKAGQETILARCQRSPQVQIVVSDGLSASAITQNLPDVYPTILDAMQEQGLSVGTSFFIRGGRVGCMDAVGDLLAPEVLILLIGERPGLGSADSLSAYMCYRPKTGVTDADRLVLSNIHRKGTPPVEAGAHIGTMVKKMLEQKMSGVNFII